jgi:indole-3-glycerol phosphate synthase
MNWLERIAARTRLDLRDWTPPTASAVAPVRDFASALVAPGLGLIAELKPRSPSAGVLHAQPDGRAFAYAVANGAAAISVLVDAPFFGGSYALLAEVRRHSALPILAKGFFLDRRQLLSARAAGADAVLLIVAMLTPDELLDLHAAARALGLAVLVEVHDAAEAELALALDGAVIGVNSRNLATLAVDPDAALALCADLPRSRVRVLESGVATPEQVAALRVAQKRGDVDAVLMGTALARASSVTAAVAALGWAA